MMARLLVSVSLVVICEVEGFACRSDIVLNRRVLRTVIGPRAAAPSPRPQPEEYSIPDAFIENSQHFLASVDEYASLYAQSIDDPEAFWGRMAASLEWRGQVVAEGKFRANFDRKQGEVGVEWLKGSTTNLAFNCLDRHVLSGRGNQVAFVCERNKPGETGIHQPDSFTYAELCKDVNKLANGLRRLGVQKGDRVTIFMAHTAETIVSMLACARIGAVHCVVFGGFSKEALASRIVDSGAHVVVTQDGAVRGSKLVELKKAVDEAAVLVAEQGGDVCSVVVLRRLESGSCEVAMDNLRDVWWHDLVASESVEAETEWIDSEDLAFILYTSGSTGKPKGIMHASGGYMVGCLTSFKYCFDVQPEDVWWCTADVGWITGHSYVCYGPLLHGCTQVIFEGIPTWPSASRIWEIVDKHVVTHLYTAPTLVRSLMSAGSAPVQRTSRASLKLLGSVGEPINPEAWRWYFNVPGEGRCPIADTWWQTETGMIMIAPIIAEGSVLRPGCAASPFFGVQPAVLDPQGNELKGECEGLLAIKAPWPSMLRGVWNNPQRYLDTYFPFSGYYLTGDGAKRDGDGLFWITGRADDVIVTSGHNIGTAEVESAAVLHPSVVEAAVVGVEHPIKGQALFLFVTLREGMEIDPDNIKKDVRNLVREKVGAFAAPDTVHIASAGLPKTRSGKIMRRILRNVAIHGKALDIKDLGDTSTLADSSVVDDLIASF